MNTALVWFLLVAGPMTSGNLQVESKYATEQECATEQEKKDVKGWTFAKCLALPASASVRNTPKQ